MGGVGSLRAEAELGEAVPSATWGPAAPERLVRGGVLLLGAKAAHVGAGFLLYVLLAAALSASLGDQGTPAFGVFCTVLAVVSPLATTLGQGTLAVTSRLVARAGHARLPGAVLAAQGALVLAVGAGLQLAAPVLASRLLGDAAYATPLRVGGLIPVLYGLRSVYQGHCNGRGRYAAQSGIDVAGSLLRAALVLAAAALGWGALGALLGWLAAAVLSLLLAIVVTRPGSSGDAAGDGASPRSNADAPRDGEPRPAAVLALLVPVLALTLVTYALPSVDLLWVRAVGAGDPATADRLAGYLTAAARIGQVPWVLGVAVAWVLFPLVAAQAGEHAAGQATAVRRRVVAGGLRAVLLLGVPVTAVLAGSAHDVYGALFPGHRAAQATFGDPIAAVSAPLLVLAPGYLAFALLSVASLLLVASGHVGRALAVMVATLLVAVALGGVLTPRLGPLGAALGSASALAGGAALGLAVLARTLACPLPLAAAARIGACGLLLLAAGHAVPSSGPWVAVECAALLLASLPLLLAARALTLDDLAACLRALRPPRAAAARETDGVRPPPARGHGMPGARRRLPPAAPVPVGVTSEPPPAPAEHVTP